jgi:acetyl esterase/lipase
MRDKRILYFTLLLLLLNAISQAEGERLANAIIYKDVPYVENGHARQRLNIYLPDGLGEGPFPLIIWIHGGAWKYGSKENCPVLPWVQKGYVVASINYRLSQDAKFPAQIEDCKAAVCWLKQKALKYKIDSSRIVAWGDSAGGHLASLLGTADDMPEWENGQPASCSRVRVVIDWFGRADLTRVCTDPAMAASPVAILLGGGGEKMAKLARKASPIFHVTRGDPPFLIMHGDRDDTVPLQQSLAFAKTLQEAGVTVRLVVLKGAGHGGSDFFQSEQMKIIDNFLDENITEKKSP